MKSAGNVKVKLKDNIANCFQKDSVVEAERLKPEKKDRFQSDPTPYPKFVYRLFYELNGKKGSIIVWPQFVEEVADM